MYPTISISIFNRPVIIKEPELKIDLYNDYIDWQNKCSINVVLLHDAGLEYFVRWVTEICTVVNSL